MIEEYTHDNLRTFKATLHHELVHAITLAHLIRGGELGLLQSDPLASMGWYAIDEYNACRTIAERYTLFDYNQKHRSIEEIIKTAEWTILNNMMCVGKGNQVHPNAKASAKTDLYYVYYELATRCALAAVSSEYSKLINSDDEEFCEFIMKIKELFDQSYRKFPHTKEDYSRWGKSLLIEYIAISDPALRGRSDTIGELSEDEQKLLDII